MMYLGIDFGKQGGFALLDQGKIVFKAPMPTTNNEINIEASLSICTVILSLIAMNKLTIYGEKLHAVFGSSAKATFSFGQAYGTTIGITEACLKEINLVRAVDWQNYIFKELEIPEIKKPNSNRRDTKAMALLAAKKLWPEVDFRATSRSKKQHDGMIDAALIAYYGERINA